MCAMYRGLAGVYDALMYDVDYDAWAAYVANLLDRLEIGRGAKILEGACGTGSITLRLAKMGYNMTATDASDDMLRIAMERARKAGVAPVFARQDLRALTSPPRDAVICCCDGPNYLTTQEELGSFFSCACACLRRGGALLFDMSSVYKLEHVLGNNLFYDDGEDVTCFWRNTLVGGPVVQMELTLFKKEGKVYSRADERHVQRAYPVEEVLDCMRRAGFTTVQAYAFGGTLPPGVEQERIQFVGVKEN